MGDGKPEWLPVDWEVCVRTRSSGKKDKYYINPTDGLKFNSKLEVLRYLKNSEKDLKMKELNKINTKNTVSEKLRSGWIKEITIKRKGGKIRRHPCYIDPVSGNQFRSVQEVLRYLETRDTDEAESKGDGQDHNNEELTDNSKSKSAGAEGRNFIDTKADRIFTWNYDTKSGTKYVELREKAVDPVAGDLDKLSQVNGKRRHEGGLSQSKRPANGKLKISASGDESFQSVKKVNIPETNALEQREKEKACVAEGQQHKNVAGQNKRKKLNSKWMNGLPRRTSKRLAGQEADPSLESKTSNRATEAATLSGEAKVNTTQDIGKPEEIDATGKSSTFCEPNEHPATTCRTENPTDNKQKEPANVPLEEHPNSSWNDLLLDPCIEFAIKTLTGAIPIEDASKVDESPVCRMASPNQTSVLPSGNIWADPCFEFAVKMLTGEMPTKDDVSHLQISFQQPLSSSGATTGCNSVTLPKIRF